MGRNPGGCRKDKQNIAEAADGLRVGLRQFPWLSKGFLAGLLLTDSAVAVSAVGLRPGVECCGGGWQKVFPNAPSSFLATTTHRSLSICESSALVDPFRSSHPVLHVLQLVFPTCFFVVFWYLSFCGLTKETYTKRLTDFSFVYSLRLSALFKTQRCVFAASVIRAKTPYWIESDLHA